MLFIVIWHAIIHGITMLIFSIKSIVSHLITGTETFFAIHNNGITFIFLVLSFLIIKNIRINTNNVIN